MASPYSHPFQSHQNFSYLNNNNEPKEFQGHFNQNSSVPGQSEKNHFFQDFSRSAIIFQVFQDMWEPCVLTFSARGGGGRLYTSESAVCRRQILMY